jgi:tRNA G18 (ribose-2'-O)-methylase SpoU
LTRRQLRGTEAISAALDSSSGVSLLLLREGSQTPAIDRLVVRARRLGIPILEESEREMRRMSARAPAADVLALEGPPLARTLDALMAGEGLVFILAGLRYPGNVGFILRCVEVAGGAGVVLDSEWGDAERDEALRVGMRPDRFFSVLPAATTQALVAARRAGRRIVAVETSGDFAPWEVDLARPLVVLVGSETTGIPEPILEQADEVVSIPIGGFIPSYNVQAAVGILLGEWMRQNA